MELEVELDELTYEPVAGYDLDGAVRIVLERLRRQQPSVTIR